MLYKEMNINQKINFKSWRSSMIKLSKGDYFPKADSYSFWSGVNFHKEPNKYTK